MKFIIEGFKQFFRQVKCKHENKVLIYNDFKYERCEYGTSLKHYEIFECQDCDKIISKKS